MVVILEELEKPAPPEGLISHCEGLVEKVFVMSEMIAGSRCFGILYTDYLCSNCRYGSDIINTDEIADPTLIIIYCYASGYLF